MNNAGAMRHRITFRSRSATKDAAGEQIYVWNDYATVSAELQRTTGREVFSSVQRAARVPVVFKIRYLPGASESMRLVHDGRVHNITSVVDPTGRKAEMIVSAEELREGGLT